MGGDQIACFGTFPLWRQLLRGGAVMGDFASRTVAGPASPEARKNGLRHPGTINYR